MDKTYIISPSFQSDWRLSMQFLMMLCIVLFTICFYFFQLGLWLIIPFAGAEFVLVAFGLWYSAERSVEKNVVHINRTTVTLEKGRRTKSSSISFERIWCEIILETVPRRWQHTRLFLRCKNDKIEFAEFLDADEQKALARELKQIIGPVGI